MGRELPILKPKQVVAALGKAGFAARRQTGSHVIMYKSGIHHPLSIPQHPKDLPKGNTKSYN